MPRLKIFFSLTIGTLLLLAFREPVSAVEPDKFITVVNPVRISSYNKTPSESVRNEYLVIRENSIPATWLLTFDAMRNPKVLFEIKSMDKHQEFGLFLEVTPAFAEDSGVAYHDTGSWHHATSVFLSGYGQDERKLLIDNLFEEFKEKFGYYPTSVGSWWTDAFSLSYMKEKYGITANLTCSDQMATDGYQIWGQPWALPYYPSKSHTAVPAFDKDSKIDVVNLQWAPRDPLNGYESSLYSTQDYMVADKRQDIDFFKKIVELYSSYGQVTVGLESDLDPDMYKYEYAGQMDIVGSMREKGVKVTTLSEFADWYGQNYPGISPPPFIKSDDFLGTGVQPFWYSGPNYRLFYIKKDNRFYINDLRIYNSDLQDPYYTSPNNAFTLSINIPFVISTSENPEDEWILPEGSEVLPSENYIEIKGQGIKIPDKIKYSKFIDIYKEKNLLRINFSKQNIPKEGRIYKDYSAEAVHFFKQKKAIFRLLAGKGWNYFKKTEYLIPQGEIYSLMYLKSLVSGSVMVFDNECLQCEYHTKLPPPVFSNRKNYVRIFSGHPIVYNSTVFKAKERRAAKDLLKKSGVKYVYLVKFEKYKEELPFSPGDLGVEKIFSNANAEIWSVK